MFLALSALLDFTLLSVFCALLDFILLSSVMLASSGAIDFIVKWVKCVYEIIRINQKYTRLPALVLLVQSILYSYIESDSLYLKSGLTGWAEAAYCNSLHTLLYCVAGFIIVKYSVHRYKLNILIVYICGTVYNIAAVLESVLEHQTTVSQDIAIAHSFVFAILIMYIFWGNPLDCIRRHINFGGTSGDDRIDFH